MKFWTTFHILKKQELCCIAIDLLRVVMELLFWLTSGVNEGFQENIEINMIVNCGYIISSFASEGHLSQTWTAGFDFDRHIASDRISRLRFYTMRSGAPQTTNYCKSLSRYIYSIYVKRSGFYLFIPNSQSGL